MMVCKEAFWDGLDVNECARYWYLQIIPCLVLVSGSLVVAWHNRPNKQSRLGGSRQLAIESVIVAAQAGLSLIHDDNQGFTILWVYCLVLIGSRRLWTHSVVLYTIAWLLQLVPVRTCLVDGEQRALHLTQFALTNWLVWSTWTTKLGVMEGPTPETSASLYQIVSFSWINDLLQEGYQRTLNLPDLYDLAENDRSSEVHRRLKYSTGNILWPTLHVLRSNLILCMVYSLGEAMFDVMPAMLVKVVLNYIEDPIATPSATAWSAVVAMFLATALTSTFRDQAAYQGVRNSVHTRGVVVSELYAKALRRKVASFEGQASTGAVINLMSIDAFKLSRVASRLHLIIGSLFQILIAFGFLFLIMGWSSVAGLVACILSTPVNTWVINRLMKYESIALRWSDKRVEKLNEVVQCIKIVKYFAWEDRFGDQVRDLRRQELAALRKRYTAWVNMLAMAVAIPFFITGATFITYTVIAGNTLTPTVAFTSLALLNLLKVPIDLMNDTIGDVVDAKVSLDRVNRFLNEDETEKFSSSQSANLGYIGFDNSSFEWASDGFRLQELSVEFPVGKLSLVCGPTGSGKTSLLMALLGEMNLTNGRVSSPTAAAYCSQQAWLLNDTIKNNILFSQPFDEQRYSEVVEACSLTPDLELLDAGDETQVGDRGIMLSGGQKQRVSLARALYSSAETLILDDCLSAVDSGTAVHIYEHCLTGQLVTNRTVILVSHNVELAISKADYVVVIEDGRVVDQGAKLVVASDAANPAPKLSGATTSQRAEPVNRKDDEERADGAVSGKVYQTFFQYCGGVWFWIAAFVLAAIVAATRNWVNVWMRNWALRLGDHTTIYYVAVFMAICVSAIITTIVQMTFQIQSSVSASQEIFEKLLSSVLHADMQFFDTTPIGRIMNRFGKDVQSMDMELPIDITGVIYFSSTTLITIGLISFVTPAFLIVAAGLTVLFSVITSYYMAAGRDIKRLDSVTKSPIFQHFGQTLSGVTTIRAYDHCDLFQQQSYHDLDTNTRAYILLFACTRWLYFRISLASAVVTLGTGSFILLASSKIDSGLAGLSLTYAMAFNSNVASTIRTNAELEMKMNSVERTTEWVGLPSEPHDVGTLPRESWPEQGEVVFDKVSLRYASHLPRVITDLSFKVEPGSKVGIVGKTGAGKSTILTALMRCLECDGGRILIDGVDIASLQLKPLRRALAIIPQDPTLFTGTIRSNLDPFDEFTDLQMFEALRRVHLLGQDLNSAVTEFGQNLSQGQRQLVCLARALLRKPKILLLDEATASIDYDTDAKIQQTISEEFAECTLLTIAHRLNSVADYDKQVVLDKGKLVKYD